MIGLEQAKRKVAEIAPVVVSALELIKDHGEPDELDWQGFRIYIRESGGLTRVAKWFLSLTHDLIEEVERLNKQLGSPYDLTVVQSQLDSSRQFVESLQRVRVELEAQLIDRERTLGTIAQVKSPDDLNEAALKRVAELESKLCGMREAIKILYKLHQSNRPDLLFPVRAKIVFGMEEIFQQVLSSAPTCKHKEEIESLQAELLEAKKWLFDDTTVSALRADLKITKEENDRLQAELDEIKESIRTDHKPKVQSDLPS